MIVVDTGPIVALLNDRDDHHQRCRTFLSDYPGPLLITAPVFTEIKKLPPEMPDKTDLSAAVSGHAFLYEGKRARTWCVKWRDHEGQHERRLGAAWLEKGAPPEGYFREREAKAALDEILVEARKGITQQRRTGVTFATAAEDWYEHGMLERDWSPSTKADYRSALVAHLIPAFGNERIEAITPARIERFRNDGVRRRGLSRRNANRLLAIAHAVFVHACAYHGLKENPAAKVPKLRESYDAARYEFFTPEEIHELAEAAASEQDGAVFLDRRVYRPAPRGARRPALARRRLRELLHSGLRGVYP